MKFKIFHRVDDWESIFRGIFLKISKLKNMFTYMCNFYSSTSTISPQNLRANNSKKIDRGSFLFGGQYGFRQESNTSVAITEIIEMIY